MAESKMRVLTQTLQFLLVILWTNLQIYLTGGQDTTRGDVCVGRCDESYFPGKACYCNEACDQFENCCYDYYHECRPDFVWSADWVEYRNHAYKFFSDQDITANEARQECRKHGAMLVSVNDPAEMEFMRLNVLRKRTLSAFIGGADDESAGVWLWEDGAPMPLPTSPWHVWYPGQPDNTDGSQGCAVLTNYLFWAVYQTVIDHYAWKSYGCNTNAKTVQGYVCEKTLQCEPNPCLNSGSCQYVGGQMEHTCRCVDNFVGDICQYQLIEGAMWTECGETTLAAGSDVMTLTSPLYPKSYPPNTRCWWRILADDDQTIQLSMEKLAIEQAKDCVFDHLTIYDVTDTGNKSLLIGPLCGKLANHTEARELVSSSNELLLEFETDDTVQELGFSLSYKKDLCAQGRGQSGCGTRGLFTGRCGSVELLTGPEDVDEPCEIVISVADGLRVNLTFNLFHILDSGKECAESALMVFEGPEVTNDNLIGSFCGFRFPWSVQSQASQLILKLWGTAWEAGNIISMDYTVFVPSTWTQVTGLPTHVITADFDSVTSFSSANFGPNERTAERNIQKFSIGSKPGQQIVLQDIGGSWNTYDVIKVFDGYDHNSRVLVDTSTEMHNTTDDVTLHSTGFQIHVTLDKPIGSDSFVTFEVQAIEYSPEISGCYRPYYSNRSDEEGTPLENHPITNLDPVVVKVSMDGNGSPVVGYDQGLYCKWTVRGDPGRLLSLTFLDANIPPLSETCHYDGVVVYDGETMHGPYCGSSDYGSLVMTNSEVQIVFYSDTAWGRRGSGVLRVLAQELDGCPVHRMEAENTQTVTAECGVLLSPGFPGMVEPGVWTWTIQAPDVSKYISIYVHYVRGPGVLDDCDQYFKIIEVSHDSGTLKHLETTLMTVCGSTDLLVPERRIRVPQYQKAAIELNTLSNSIARRWEFKLTFKIETMEEPTTTSAEFECPEEYVYWRQSCYKYSPWVYRHYEDQYKFQETWQTSLEHCEQAQNATLLSIHDENESHFIKYTLGNEWFWDRASSYQGNGRLIFMGLNNKYGPYQWTDGSQLSYADWYVPRKPWEQSVLLEDTIATDFLELSHAQPTADVGSLCTALLITSPFESLNWVKVPCDYPVFRSGLICERIATAKEMTSTDVLPIQKRSTAENMNTTTEVCPVGSMMVQRTCVRLLTNYEAVRGRAPGWSYQNASDVCLESGGTMAQVDSAMLATLRHYLILWRHDPTTGHIWIRGSSADNNVIKVFKDNSQDEESHYEFGTFMVSNDVFTYPRNVLCQTDTIEHVEVCSPQEFECADESCITVDSVCDGLLDCPSGADELFCECSESSFECSSGQCISISLHCDFHEDCEDGSDEQFCVVLDCAEDQYMCASGQCIPRANLCDFKKDCKDGSDEDSLTCENDCKGMQCFSGSCIHPDLQGDLISDCPGRSAEDEVERSVVTFFDFYAGDSRLQNLTGHVGCDLGEDYVQCREGHSRCYHRSETCVYDTVTVDEDSSVTVQGTCRDGAHLRNYCGLAECPGMFHCPASFCLPHRKVCDGLRDCPRGEDELDCSNHTCTGMFRCKGKSFCLAHSEVCDGVVHCPKYGDDEKYCNLRSRRSIAVSEYNGTAGINDTSSVQVESLCSLGCSCSGHVVDCTDRGLTLTLHAAMYPPTTKALLLSGNHFKLSRNSFSEAVSLARLVLRQNALGDLTEEVFDKLQNLYDLDLSTNHLKVINTGVFSGLISLRKLNLDDNALLTMHRTTFTPLIHIEHLIITNNLDLEVEQDVFEDIPTLEILNSDAFKFCCIVPQAHTCTPEANEFSSCDDLMANYALRIAIWVLGFSACIGNFFVIVWRTRQKTTLISSFYIINLGCSDFIMGVYMLIIASVDMYYRGRYIIYDDAWRSSAGCKFAGILAMLSSEVSVFMLTAITVDRVINIMFPLKRGLLTMKHAKMVAACGWSSCLILSIIPSTGIGYFGENFFGNSGVCLPFQVTSEKNAGWEYAVFIFIAVNLFSFAAIFVGYAGIFMKVKESIEQMKEKSTSSTDEYSLAKKLVLIVATDFLCWVPIILIGIAALAGARISPEVSAWIAVFILPLNSAINPLLYTISALDCKKKSHRSRSIVSNTMSTAVSRRVPRNVASEASVSDGVSGGAGETKNGDTHAV